MQTEYWLVAPCRNPDDNSMTANLHIGIFIIAYKTLTHIAPTLARIPPEIGEQIDEPFVVDDYSIDETVHKALALQATYPKLRVRCNRINRRNGGNQKIGFQCALDRGFDAVVMLHADEQYAPEHLPQVVAPLREGTADVMLGSRMIHKPDALKGGMPRDKFAGNIVLPHQNRMLGMKRLFSTSGNRGNTCALKPMGNPGTQTCEYFHRNGLVMQRAFSPRFSYDYVA